MKTNDEDDYRIEEIREKLIEILSQDEHMTMEILNQLDENETLYTSEIFEEIAYNLKSIAYIQCLKNIEKKYNKIDISDAIKTVIEYIDCINI